MMKYYTTTKNLAFYNLELEVVMQNEQKGTRQVLDDLSLIMWSVKQQRRGIDNGQEKKPCDSTYRTESAKKVGLKEQTRRN